MKQLQKKIIIGFVLLVLACDTKEEIPAEGVAWFPQGIGYAWVYDVKETKYDTLIQNTKLSYQERYEIVDVFKNQLNEIMYVIYVSIRNHANEDWKYSKTWSSKISYLNEVIVQEENIAYIKMLLPVSNGLTWKGNKYNDIESTRTNGRIDNFVVHDFKKPYNDYAKTFIVEESNDENFSYEDIRYSVYAENIGLIYRINKYIEFCDEIDCFGLGLRKHEVTKEQTLVSYEIE